MFIIGKKKCLLKTRARRKLSTFSLFFMFNPIPEIQPFIKKKSASAKKRGANNCTVDKLNRVEWLLYR